MKTQTVLGKCNGNVVGACLCVEGKDLVMPRGPWTREKAERRLVPEVGQGGEVNTVVSGRSV